MNLVTPVLAIATVMLPLSPAKADPVLTVNGHPGPNVVINGTDLQFQETLANPPPGVTTAVRNIDDKLRDVPWTQSDFQIGSIQNGDETAAFQNAILAAVYTRGDHTLNCQGTHRVKSITIPGSIRFNGECTILGVASDSTNAVIEITGGDITVDGSLKISAQYSITSSGVPIYGSGVWVHGTPQYATITNVTVNAAQLCWKFGSASEPSALVSEITVLGGQTYGCPRAAAIIGTETYVNVVGAVWSSDDLGATGTAATVWANQPHRNLSVQGGQITFSNGELIATGVSTGVLVSLSPLTGAACQSGQTVGCGEGTFYGSAQVVNSVIESGSPLGVTNNPNALVINSPFGRRGLIMFRGNTGFNSNDSTATIQTDTSYDGEVVLRDNTLWFKGARTQPTIQAGSVSTDVYVDDRGLGVGFGDPLSKISGNANLHFSNRLVLRAGSLAGQSLTGGSANTLKFTSLDQFGNLNRFSGNYNPLTGVFTVPPGGFKTTHVEARVKLSSAVQATAYVVVGGGGVAAGEAVNGNVSVSADLTNLPAGTQISVIITPISTTTAGNNELLNTFTIGASN